MRSLFERLPLAGALFVLCGSLLSAATHADWRQVNEDGFGAVGANSTWAMDPTPPASPRFSSPWAATKRPSAGSSEPTRNAPTSC